MKALDKTQTPVLRILPREVAALALRPLEESSFRVRTPGTGASPHQSLRASTVKSGLSEDFGLKGRGDRDNMRPMSSPKRPFSFLSWFAWSLLAWLALAAAVFGLIHDPDLQVAPWRCGLVLVMIPIYILCERQALLAAPGPGLLARLARIIYWAPAAAIGALCVVLFQGGLEVSTGMDRLLLLAAVLLPVIGFTIEGLVKTLKGKPARLDWVVDFVAGAACMAVLIVAAYMVFLKTVVEPLRLKAEQRWTEIGHPMREFVKNLAGAARQYQYHQSGHR